MDRPCPDKSLVERILDAPRRVVLLTGPAASGKTAAALATYRSFLDAGGQSRCLLLGPNAPAVASLRRRLLDESPNGVIVAPAVLTFAGLAGRILAGSATDARPLGAFERNLLLRRIVDGCHRAGRLTALAAVADTPGLVATLDHAIAELKRAAIDPEQLARAVRQRRGKNRDLLEIYRRYQEHLHESNTFDVEGQMWLARDCLVGASQPGGPKSDQGPRTAIRGSAPAGGQTALPALDGIEAVVVDGFTDFTPTQLEMLALLSPRLRRVLITLCYAEDGRERMWHWARRTVNSVRRAFGEQLTEIAANREDGPPLRRLWQRVFDFDAAPCEAPSGLHVISAAGVDAEVAAVARHVKRLLLEGAPAGSIVVTARDMDPYRPAVERIFAEHDIPVAPRAQPLADLPIVRFVLDAAALAPEFAFRHVLRAIKNSYFRPQALGEFDDGTVATAEMLIREGNVLGGRNTYAEVAKRLAGRIAARAAAAEDEDDEPPCLGPIQTSPEAIEAAADMLAKLFDLADRARAQLQTDGAAALAPLIDALALRAAACYHGDPALIARDLRALEALDSTLAASDEPIAGLAHLREALSCVSCGPRRGEAMVDCLDVLDARALRYRHVFCLGVCEGRFPRRLTEGSLLGEADRRTWARHGVVLDSRADLAAREMLLFYLAVSRPDETLTVSWLEADSSGAPGAPSGFLLSLLAPAGGLEGVGVERIPPGRFLPDSGEPASRRDALNAAVAGLFQENLCRPGRNGDSHLFCEAPFGPAAPGTGDCPHFFKEGIVRAAAGIWARHRRWARGQCDAFDGRLSDGALLQALDRRYRAEVVFSASRLNCYGQCPWRYFGQYVLRLAPLGEPQRRLGREAHGRFVHNVLCRLMVDLRESARGTAGSPSRVAVRLAEIDEPALRDALDRAVTAESDAVEARTVPYPALWDIQRRRMHREILEYLSACRARDDLQPACLHFELGFDAEADPAQTLDPASTAEAVTLATPAGAIRVRGKIDRVDRVRFEGRDALLVVDYKTGRLPTQADIRGGRSLQLAIYAAAAEEVLGEPSFGGAFHRIGGRQGSGAEQQFFAAMKPSRGGYAAVADFDERRGEALETIGRFVDGMRSGRFDVAPTHDCPSYCPFRQICHYSPVRAEFKGAGGGADEEEGSG